MTIGLFPIGVSIKLSVVFMTITIIDTHASVDGLIVLSLEYNYMCVVYGVPHIHVHSW